MQKNAVSYPLQIIQANNIGGPMFNKAEMLEKYLLGVYKNTSSKSILFGLVSDLLLIVFGTIFFLYAKCTDNLLSSIFFAISIILGFVSIELDKHIVTLVRLISETAYLTKEIVTDDEKYLSTLTTSSTICNITAGIFGAFGLLFLIF